MKLVILNQKWQKSIINTLNNYIQTYPEYTKEFKQIIDELNNLT